MLSNAGGGIACDDIVVVVEEKKSNGGGGAGDDTVTGAGCACLARSCAAIIRAYYINKAKNKSLVPKAFK